MSKTDQAKEIASGGGIVFGASILDRGLRLIVTWLLSGYLGPEVFGVYTIVITIMTLVKMFSPLGTELGTVYFGARHRKNEDKAKLKAMFSEDDALWLVTAKKPTNLIKSLVPNERILVVDSVDRWGRAGINPKAPFARWEVQPFKG